MDKSTYIIWKHESHGSISDYSEVIGLFHGTYEEADELLEYLNTHDDSVLERCGGRGYRYGYYRTEPNPITLKEARSLYPTANAEAR